MSKEPLLRRLGRSLENAQPAVVDRSRDLSIINIYLYHRFYVFALFQVIHQALGVARSFGTHFIVTANTTDDGGPVYMTQEHTWTTQLPEAHATQSEDARDELLAVARTQERQVCDPYAFKVELSDGVPTPTTARERIRATGPTTPIRRPDAGVDPWQPADKEPAECTNTTNTTSRSSKSERVSFVAKCSGDSRARSRRPSSSPCGCKTGCTCSCMRTCSASRCPTACSAPPSCKSSPSSRGPTTKGYGHLTTRQNVQYNWPKLEDVPKILDELASVADARDPDSGNCIRNITSDPLAGVARDEIEDPRPYCELIRQWSTFHPEFAFLPRKFKIAVTGSPSEDRAAVRVHDYRRAHRRQRRRAARL